MNFTSAGTTYKTPSLDTFCDSLVREQEKLLHLGLVKTGNSSNKALVAQQSQGFKNPKKQYLKRNGPITFVGFIFMICYFCNRDGHIESKCFKKMEALEATMKKHNIHLDTSSTSYSGQAFSASANASSSFGYVLNVSSSTSSQSGSLILEPLIT